MWGDPTGPGGFPSQRPVTPSFDVFFDLRWTKDWANIRDAGNLGRDRILWRRRKEFANGISKLIDKYENYCILTFDIGFESNNQW